MRSTFVLALLCLALSQISAQKFTISGHVLDASNGEALISSTVYVENFRTGTLTNTYGFYSITLDQGDYDLSFSYLGYNDLKRSVALTEDITMDIEIALPHSLYKKLW